MSFVGILADQELLSIFGDLFLSLPDVLLCRLDGGVAKEVLHLHDVLAVVVQIGGLRDSEVVALDVQVVLAGEPLELLYPFIGWIMAIAWWEHFVFVLGLNLLLVGQDGLEGVLVH